jgi:CDP-diacylglycerol--serine O-phosphatidyltransferase
VTLPGSDPAGRVYSGEDFGRRRLPRGLTLRALVPNAITSAALCSGLTGIRFAIGHDFHYAVLAVLLAGLLDGIDGRVCIHDATGDEDIGIAARFDSVHQGS